MYTIRESYTLKHSRLAIVFQVILGLLLSVLFNFLLVPLLWLLISLLVLLASWHHLSTRPRLLRLEYLDQQDWSLQFASSTSAVTVQVNKWLQHGIYIVLYYQTGQGQHSIVIWRDQLNQFEWKQLLKRCQM